MSDWLSDTMKCYEEFESPQRFYYWSLLAAVSGIVKDRVYWDKFLYKLHPNIYVLLYGPSAVKKGAPIGVAKSILNRINNTRVINGRATVEAIIKELGNVKTEFNDAGEKIIINDSCGTIFSPELSSSIIGNTNSLDVITDLFDRIANEGKWKHLLKGEGSVDLKDPTVTWLAGTNEALFREFIPEKNLKGGLIGRMFIIGENKSDVVNSLMFPPKVMPDLDKIARGISHLQGLEGPFEISTEIREAFDSWYKDFTLNIAPKLEDDTGTVGRLDDSICRVAMLISLARRGDMVIRIEDIKEAMKEVLKLVAQAKKITSTAKERELTLAQKRELFLQYLANTEGHVEERSIILKKFILKMDHEDLDNIVMTLEAAKVLRVSRSGKDIIYSFNMQNEDVRKYVEELKK